MSTQLGNKSIMARNIQYYMDLTGKTRNDMCGALGVKYTTFTDWVKGKTYPRIDSIEKMANYFGVEKSDLIEPRTGLKEVKAVKIPVLGMVHAGYPMEAIEEILDWEEVTPEMASKGDLMALRVQGDCMEPKFSDGDTVIVRCQSTAESGDIVIAMVNHDEAEMKKLKRFDNGFINLIPLNPSYSARSFSPQEIEELPIRILGKVVELRAKF